MLALNGPGPAEQTGCFSVRFHEVTLIYSNNKLALLQMVLMAIRVVPRGGAAHHSSERQAPRADAARHALTRHQEALLWA